MEKMLDKDKLILVFYINVADIDRADVIEYLNDARKGLADFLDESILSYFIPVEEEESHLECINPVKLEGTEYEEALKKLDEANKKFSEVLEILTNNNFDNELQQ